MSPGACPKKIFDWMFYGQSIKIFASHKLMKTEPDFTCLQASDKETDQLMSGMMLYKHRLHLLNTASILHRDIFWFFLKDEDLFSKTINACSVDLDKFPASKVRQLTRKTEASKATTHHIK